MCEDCGCGKIDSARVSELQKYLDFRKEGPVRNGVTGWDFSVDEPLKLREAIRNTCLHCTGGESEKAVRDCDGVKCVGKGEYCELWPYRIRQKIDKSRGKVLSPLKAVRSYCIWCQGNREYVRDCQDTYCFLWPYRMGKKPESMVSEAEREAAKRKAALSRAKLSSSKAKAADGEPENEG